MKERRELMVLITTRMRKRVTLLMIAAMLVQVFLLPGSGDGYAYAEGGGTWADEADLTLQYAGQDPLTIGWTPPSNRTVQYYNALLYAGGVRGAFPAWYKTSADTERTVYGLDESETYLLIVEAYAPGDVYIGQLEKTFVLNQWNAGPPWQTYGDLTTTFADEGGVKLQWKPYTGAVNFYIVIIRDGNGDYVADAIVSGAAMAAPEATIAGLTPGGAYTADVQAFDAGENEIAKLTGSFKLPDAPPDHDGLPPVWPQQVVLAVYEVKHNAITVGWPAASDKIGEYRVSLNGQQAAAVTSATYAYTFAGLEAATLYTLSVVAVDQFGASGTPLSATERTAKAPELQWEAPQFGGEVKALRPGETMRISMQGASGAQAEARVHYDSWYNAGGQLLAQPAAMQAVVPLVEAVPGTYTGEWKLAENLGIARVNELMAVLQHGADPADALTMSATVGLPVGGKLEIEVQPGGEAVQSLIVKLAGSNGNSYGVLPVAAPGVYIFPEQIPADDYTIYVTERYSGRILRQMSPIAVKGSLTHRETIDGVGMSTLQVKVTDEHGAPIPGAVVTAKLAQSEISQRTDKDGMVYLGNRFAQGDTITMAVSQAPSEYIQPDGSLTIAIGAGLHEERMQLQTRATTEVSGIVSDEQGQPVAGMTLVFTQQDPVKTDQFRTIRATTDAAGLYRVSLFNGQAQVEGSVLPHRSHAVQASSVIATGEQLTHHLQAQTAAVGSIDIQITAQYPGEKERQISPDHPDYKKLSIELRDATGKATRVEQFPFTPEGVRGDSITLCVDGSRLSLLRTCQTYTLSERDVEGKFKLLQLGGTVIAAIAEASGTFVGVISGVDQFYYDKVKFVDDVPIIESVPNAGTYSLRVYKGEFGRSEVVEKLFAVRAGDTVDLGLLQLPSDVPGDVQAAFDTDQDSIVVGQSVQLHAAYRNGSGSSQTDVQLFVSLPEGARILADSILLNNKPIGPEFWRQNGRTASVKLVDALGAEEAVQVQMSVRIPADYSSALAVFDGKITVDADGVRDELGLGSAMVDVSAIQLNAPEQISSLQTFVSGRAIAGSVVKVYADQVLVGQATAPQSGHWSMPAELPIVSSSHSYAISALAEHEGKTYYAPEQQVFYSDRAPAIIEFSMQGIYPGRITTAYTYNPSLGIAGFPFLLEPGSIVYRARFNNPHAVSNIRFLVGPTELPASLDSDGVYTATLYSGSEIELYNAYHPVYIQYDDTPSVQLKSLPATEEQIRASLPHWWQEISLPSAGALETEKEGNTEKWSLRLNTPEFGAGSSLKATMTAQRNVDYNIQGKSSIGSDGAVIYGYDASISKHAGSGTPFPSAPTGHRDSRLKLLKWVATGGNNVHATLRITGYNPYDGDAVAASSKKGKVRIAALNTQIAKSSFEIVLDGTDLGLNMLGSKGFRSTLDDLQALIDECYDNCSMEKALENHRKIEEVMENAMLAEVGKWMMAGTGFVGAALGPPGWVLSSLIFVNSQLFGAVLDNEVARQIKSVMGNMKIECEFDEDEFRNRNKRRFEQQLGSMLANPKYIFDPSGYVYEVHPAERIEGVRATALQWNEAEGQWNTWQAEEYLQSNPLFSDADGKYGWDVPEGKWKVRYEKEGYVTAYSDERIVLPPHYDVNIPMVSTDPPQFVSVVSEDGGQSAALRFSRYMEPGSLTADTVSVQLADGTAVEGTLQSMSAVDYQGKQVAKTVKFVPTQRLAVGASIRVTVSHLAMGYNGLPLVEDTTLSATVTAADMTAPGQAEQLAVIPGDGMLQVVWRDPADDDLEHVVVRWKAAGVGGYQEAEVAAGVQWLTIDHLTADVSYEIEVVAFDKSGHASAAATAAAVPLAAAPAVDRTEPGAVRRVSVEAGTRSLKVNWTDPSDADFTAVELAWYAAGSAEPLGSVTVARGQQHYTIPDLTPDTSYVIELAAFDRTGNASRYVELSGRTSASDDASPGDGSPGGAPGGGYIPPANPNSGSDNGDQAGDPNKAVIPWSEWGGREATELFGGELSIRPADRIDVSEQTEGGMAVRRSEEGAWPGDSKYVPAGIVYVFAFEPPAKKDGRIRFDAEFKPAGDWKDRLKNGLLDPTKLGVYKQSRRDPSGWEYVGGFWNAASERLSVRLEAPGIYTVMAYMPAFTDMAGHWARRQVEALAARHLAGGVGGQQFDPERSVTRAEMTAFIIRLLEWAAGERLSFDSRQSAGFGDVPGGAWYKETLDKAVSNGLLFGADRRLRPDDPVTREEAAVLVDRAMERLSRSKADRTHDDSAVREGGSNAASVFTDAAGISGWAAEAVSRLYDRGIVSGYPDGSFDPQAPMSRAQSAAMAWNLMSMFDERVQFNRVP
ncbi:S-layer homology domain-containing protein [Paenibacillus oceani]|uniref:S-layer homology domain-containing protein n=1 Tax=Paenibacillus oceani TaxID=2772510 RepID=A0A927GZQ9_9BACL|nr:S-layer homology domain-containing protein [Paenibacillus oceani]MBD2862503.1 S-layer homology domain-containing protein [Paenibacillus oceani]